MLRCFDPIQIWWGSEFRRGFQRHPPTFRTETTKDFARNIVHPSAVRIGMSRSALFVIDIQKELAQDPQTEIPHAARIRSAGDKILSTAREIVDSYRTSRKQSPSIIVFVQHEEIPDNGTLLRGAEPWKLVFNPRDNVEEELLVAKTTGQCQ